MGDDLKARLLSAGFGAVLTGIVGWLGGLVPVYDALSEKSAESQARLTKLQNSERQISDLLNEKGRKESEYGGLLRRFQELESAYHRATTVEGPIFDGSMLDESFQEAKLTTGAKLRFKLTSSSCFVTIVRVTNEGPIVSYSGPKPLIKGKAAVSEQDGPFSYLLQKNTELHLQVSTRGSDYGYLKVDLSDMEDILLICLEYDVGNQAVELKYRKWMQRR